MACSRTFYPSGGFWGVLVPTAILRPHVRPDNMTIYIQCPTNPPLDGSLPALVEIGNANYYLMFGAVLLLWVIAMRSMSRVRWDFYRLLAVYMIGTLGVPVSLLFGPLIGGFKRVAGVGVFVHNICEIYIVGSLWNGLASSQLGGRGIWVILMYSSVMLILIGIATNLQVLFFLAMFQGATLDYILLYSFGHGVRILSTNEDGKFCQNNTYWWYAFVAAFLHVSTIQPLFFSFSTGFAVLGGPTVLFIFPTFVFYMVFAFQNDGKEGRLFGPTPILTDAEIMESVNQQEMISLVRSRFAKGLGTADALQSIDIIEVRQTFADPENLYKVGLRLRHANLEIPTWVAGAVSAFLNSIVVFMSPCYINTATLYGCLPSPPVTPAIPAQTLGIGDYILLAVIIILLAVGIGLSLTSARRQNIEKQYSAEMELEKVSTPLSLVNDNGELEVPTRAGVRAL